MAIDKFGRYNPYSRSIRGSACRSIKLTYEGDIDIQYKRLCNIADAIFDEDAVNLNTLKQNCLYQTDGVYFDAASKKISNLAQPESHTDAATKSYVDENLNRILYNIYTKTTNDKPIKSKDDWMKEYL